MKKYTIIVLILVLGLSAQPPGALAQSPFKILSYNVLMGLQQDSLNQADYIKWVKEFDPDIVAYQEMNDFTQKSLEQLAARYGHPYAVQSKLEGFPVALSSKHPIINVQKVVDNMWHAYLYATVKDIHVFVIHFSPFDYKKRNQEVRNVLAHAASLPKNERILIMGDFNSLDRSDSPNYSQEMVEGMRRREKEQAHIRNLNEGQIDYTVMDQLATAGFKDTYWLVNKDFKHSIPTKKYGSGNFRRIDFMWANPKMAKDVKKATIIHDDYTDRMSDHYPVYVEFDLR